MSEISDQSAIETFVSNRHLHAIGRQALQQPVTVSEANYTNRADIIDDIHLEYRAGESACAFQVRTVTGEAGAPDSIACSVAAAGVYVRYCLSFSAAGCSPGDILSLRWLGRITTADGAVAIPVQLMVSDETKNGKKRVLPTTLTFAANDAVQERNLLLQVLALVPGDKFHLVFDMPSGSVVDVIDLQVAAIGRRPPVAETRVGQRLHLLEDLQQVLPRDQPVALALPAERGILAQLDAQGVSGLAWDAAEPLGAVSLELVIDGVVSGLILAEPLSGEATVEDSAPARFSHLLPSTVGNGQQHVVSVRLASTGEDIAGSPRHLQLDSQQEGVFQLDAAGQLAGWAVDRRLFPAPVTVEILADDRVLLELLADQPHPVLTGAHYNGGRCAFRAPLPLELQDGALHLVSARIKDGVRLAGGEIAIHSVKSRYILHLDAGAADRVTGWAMDTLEPAVPLTMELRVDGRSFGRLRADRPRSDLDGQRRGFNVAVPAQAQALEFRAGTGEVLAGFDIRPTEQGPLWQLVGQDSTPAAAVSLPGDAQLEDFVAAGGQAMFDAAWYQLAHPTAAAEIAGGTAGTAFEHWWTIGVLRGWSPNDWFDEAWYRLAYDDVALAIAEGQERSGFAHWLRLGAAEWRAPNALVDPLAHRGHGSTRAETALAAVENWRASLATPPRPVVPVPPAPLSQTFLTIAAARQRKGLIYDSHIQRLIEDIGLTDPAAAAALQRDLAANESQMMQWLLDRPRAEQPLVSIIMPTFNRGFLIAEAIQSVLDQSWTNWELIICDDGSTDKTAFVVKGFDDPRIRYMALEKSNGAIARNFGMKFSKGRYITFLDSDNIWHPLFIDISVAGLASSGQAITYSGYIDTEMKGPRLGSAVLKFTPFDYQALLRRNYIDLNTICMDRAVYDQLGGFNESLGRVQDWDLMLKYGRVVAAQGIPIYTAFYRRNLAWGQVTDLQAHTDFNALVGANALARLASKASLVRSGYESLNLTLLGGSSFDTALDVLALADLLQDFSQIRLVLPDLPALRQLQVRSGLAQDCHILWLAAGADPAASLAGEAVLVPEGLALPPLASGSGTPLPVLQLTRQAEQAGLRPQSLLQQGSLSAPQLIGVLPLGDVEAELDCSALIDTSVAAGNRVMVVAPEELQYEWELGLAARSRGGDTALLVGLSGDGSFSLSSFEGGRPRQLEVSEAMLLAMVPHCRAVTLAAPSALGRLLAINLGVAAFCAERPLLAIADPAYEAWLESRLAFAAPNHEVAKMISRMAQVLADVNGASRTARRSRRQFEHLYRRNAMADRLKLAFAVLVGR